MVQRTFSPKNRQATLPGELHFEPLAHPTKNHVNKFSTKSYKKNNKVITSLIVTLLITLLSTYIFSQFSFAPAVTYNYMHTKIENRCYTLFIPFRSPINSCRHYDTKLNTYEAITNKGNLLLPSAICFF